MVCAYGPVNKCLELTTFNQGNEYKAKKPRHNASSYRESDTEPPRKRAQRINEHLWEKAG